MIWLEKKYLNLISSYLENFKWKGNIANCRCPICNDSKINKNKARGYFLEKNGSFNYYCHNCGASLSFLNFLKEINYNYYIDFVKEKYSISNNLSNSISLNIKSKSIVVNNPFKDLPTIYDLDNNHYAKKYVLSRKIPIYYQKKFYYVEKFKEFTNNVLPKKFETLDFDESRLLIPFIDDSGVFGYQGRSFNKFSKLKYITILLDETKPKFFNLQNINIKRQVRILEAPLDAVFVWNALAACGGDLVSQLDYFNVSNDNFIIIYDNEKRSKETLHKIEKAIHLKYNVVIWPDYIKEKDVNEMIISGYTLEDIENIIKENTFYGLDAELRLKHFKR